jgi:hypothetical protein
MGLEDFITPFHQPLPNFPHLLRFTHRIPFDSTCLMSKCHRQSRSFQQSPPLAKPGACRLLAPQRGLIANGKRKTVIILMAHHIYFASMRKVQSRNCQTPGVSRQSREFT